MQRGKLRKKKIVAGPLVREVVYTPPTKWDTPQSRKEREEASTAAREASNDRTAKRKLEMLFAANFDHHDAFMTLTYREESLPASRSGVQKDVRFFLRRLRNWAAKKLGRPLKYAYVIEHKHGAGRWHSHFVVNVPSECRAQVFALWPYGEAGQQDMKPLKREGGHVNYARLAEYMTKESDGLPVGARIWTASKNLKKPVVTYSWVNARPLRLPKGAVLVCECKQVSAFGYYAYMEYYRPERNTHHTGGAA